MESKKVLKSIALRHILRFICDPFDSIDHWLHIRSKSHTHTQYTKTKINLVTTKDPCHLILTRSVTDCTIWLYCVCKVQNQFFEHKLCFMTPIISSAAKALMLKEKFSSKFTFFFLYINNHETKCYCHNTSDKHEKPFILPSKLPLQNRCFIYRIVTFYHLF